MGSCPADTRRVDVPASRLPARYIGRRDDVNHLLRNVIDMMILPLDSEAFSVARLFGEVYGGI
jgi:hypothetical protein